MIDPSEDYKIKFCLDFFFGKINSKKFKQVKSQEENNGISKERSKEREVNMSIREFFFSQLMKKQVIS